ncbi:ABC transporter ATP-binding protein [Brevundimonas lutea]|uniref:ABC transporter ATP-binding protein n=1 Tax=Brevundimonas lutea TaxID=2293980 RepID=UPI0013CF3BA0|nr:ABC transporter ATP-binding protein [Brevundimonas lutea]
MKAGADILGRRDAAVESERGGRPALVLTGVRAGYGGLPVLDGLDLTIGQGEVYALLGPNGSGKSTAARVACGLLNVNAGLVEVGEREVVLDHRARRCIGLAPQETALFPALTVRETLTTVARLAGLRGRAVGEAVERALEITAAAPRADHRVASLSGGWRRRANLAAALVGDPDLIVLDEPTEGVDAETRGQLARAVRSAVAGGAGCLMISHDAAFVEATADRVGVMARGRLAAEGAPQALLDQTFGEARLLTVRLAQPAEAALARALEACGLEPRDGGRHWRRLAADAANQAAGLSALVDEAGGEVAVRRPGLDDLVARIVEESA